MGNEERIESISEAISVSEKEKRLWVSFLTKTFDGSEEVLISAQESLRALAELIGEDALSRKIKKIAGDVELDLGVVLELVLAVQKGMRKEKDRVINELRYILSEMETPIIRIWTDILLVALIGNLCGERMQSTSERLLDRISSTRSKIVLVDVTGVPNIDTSVGGLLIEMFNAIKLLGAEAILTGIKPDVAHTLVKLGIDFQAVTIARDLEDALRKGISIVMEEAQRSKYYLGMSMAGELGPHGGANVND